MKKIVTLFLCSTILLILFGCKPIEISVNYNFKNSSVQSKNQLLEKITFFKNRLISLVEEFSDDMSYEKNESQLMLLNSESAYTPRGDIPEQVEPVFENNGIDSELIGNTTMVLDEFQLLIESSEDLIENEFCSVQSNGLNYSIKIRTEGNQLYIESYQYSPSLLSEDFFSTIHADIIYFNIISDEMYFEYFRDYQSTIGDLPEHKLYYDFFYESGDILSVSLNMLDESEIEYQIFDRETGDVFMLSNSDNELAMNFQSNTGKLFSIVLTPQRNLEHLFIKYGSFFPTFSYTYWKHNNVPELMLEWNLFYVNGWNEVYLNNYIDDQIYMDGIQKLENFSIHFVQEVYSTAIARVSVPVDGLTNSLIDLSEYDMLFDEITYAQLQIDITSITQNYESRMMEYGFDLDMDANRHKLMDMIPFGVNDEIIQELLERMQN